MEKRMVGEGDDNDKKRTNATTDVSSTTNNRNNSNKGKQSSSNRNENKNNNNNDSNTIKNNVQGQKRNRNRNRRGGKNPKNNINGNVNTTTPATDTTTTSNTRTANNNKEMITTGSNGSNSNSNKRNNNNSSSSSSSSNNKTHNSMKSNNGTISPSTNGGRDEKPTGAAQQGGQQQQQRRPRNNRRNKARNNNNDTNKNTNGVNSNEKNDINTGNKSNITNNSEEKVSNKNNNAPNNSNATAAAPTSAPQETTTGTKSGGSNETSPVGAAAPITTTENILTEKKFQDIEKISMESKKAISEVLKYTYLTKVQDATLDSVLSGFDVVAKAKTGSGKTVAFLLPMIESIIHKNSNKNNTTNNNNNRNNSAGQTEKPMDGLILSPTRELAMQIAKEAEQLIRFHKGLNVACFIGGTKMSHDISKLNQGGGTNSNGRRNDSNNINTKGSINILICTPGRLVDHLERDSCNIQERIGKISMFVLDEADQLLDMGFKPALTKIMSFLPKEQRQTLLYSATFPKSVKQMTQSALKPDHKFLDTIEDGDQQTNHQVKQEYIICSLDNVTQTLERALSEHMTNTKKNDSNNKNGYKVIVFFNTARVAGFMAQMFLFAGYPNILEMHSRKSQAYRKRVSEQFHTGRDVIMFSSDVSARGVDYPDVSLIVQVGLPANREQYIHRLGRTGRAGNVGRGLLLLCDFGEERFLKELTDLQIEDLSSSSLQKQSSQQRREDLSLPVASILASGFQDNKELTDSAEKAYQAFLGFYNSNMKQISITDKTDLVQLANHYSSSIGLKTPPALLKKTIKKMGLWNVQGLRVE